MFNDEKLSISDYLPPITPKAGEREQTQRENTKNQTEKCMSLKYKKSHWVYFYFFFKSRENNSSSSILFISSGSLECLRLPQHNTEDGFERTLSLSLSLAATRKGKKKRRENVTYVDVAFGYFDGPWRSAVLQHIPSCDLLKHRMWKKNKL